MSLYSLTAAGLQRIQRKWFGVKIPNPDGTTTDTGVEEFKRELLAGLSDTAPIPLSSPFQLIQPGNAPAQQIFVNNDDHPVLQFVNYNANTITNLHGDGTIERIDNAFNNTNSNAVITNQNNVSGNPSLANVVRNSNPSRTTPITGGGRFTGSVTLWTGASVSVVGCVVTLTPTTSTLNFVNGSLASTS